MALDGILLYKIVPEIQTVLPARIQKIYQTSSTEVLFQLHTHSGKKQLLISCHSQYNRMLLTKRDYPTPFEPSNFIMVLRKHLEGSIIQSIEQIEYDRWCKMNITTHDMIGDETHLTLYIELMGKYANIILVNEDNIIIDALKRIPPFENNRRTIQPGASFKPTPSQAKKDPFKETTIDLDTPLTAQFSGFSPFLSSEIEYRLNHGQSFTDIMNEIKQSTSLFIANQNNEAVFHCIDLTSIGKTKQYPLFEGLEILYYHKEEKERIKDISGDIFRIVKRELKHQKQKLPRLLSEYDNAMDCDKWRKYGDLLYAYQIKDTKGQDSITLEDYETNEPVKIPLDPKIDGNRNAQKCYTKYAKLKKGQQYLQEQIAICTNEIQYFEGLLEQLELADFHTATEIRQELIKGGYLKEKTHRKVKKKEVEPTIHSIKYSDTVTIYYGKNNLQNEYLTFKKAHKNYYWFHAKDYHGAHVVIATDQLDEPLIRFAANLAAYYSKGRNSSSVPVNYTQVKELKKIPGAKPGMVQLNHYQTIYIDPSSDELEAHGILIDSY